MKFRRYPFTKTYENALFRLALEEPFLGGVILNYINTERLRQDTMRELVEHARSVAKSNGNLAPTFSELYQALYKSELEGKLTSEERAKCRALVRKARQSNDVPKDSLVAALYEEIRRDALLESQDKAMKLYADGKTEAAWQAMELAALAGRDLIDGGNEMMFPNDFRKVPLLVHSIMSRDRCPTHVPALDEYMRGGLGPGELATALGSPNSGKSTFLCSVAVRALLYGGARVIYYTFEMLAHDVTMKIVAGLAGTKLRALERGQDLGAYDRVEEILRDRNSYYIVKHAPAQTLSVASIRAHIRAQNREHGFRPTLVIVDYADLLADSSGRKDGNTYLTQGDIYVDLKALASEFGIPIWTASQAKRDAAANRVLYMDDVADSYRKVHVADYIVSICAQSEERQAKQARLYLAKNRFGEVDVELGPFETDFAKGRFIAEGLDEPDEDSLPSSITIRTMPRPAKVIRLHVPKGGSRYSAVA